MIDVTQTIYKLTARALSQAPVTDPWACLTFADGDILLAYRQDDEDNTIDAVRLTSDEDPAQVYANIAAKYDNRRPLDNEVAVRILSKGAIIIESPAMVMFTLEPSVENSFYPDQIAINTPKSVFTIPYTASTTRDASGFIRDDILDDIVFVEA